MWIHYLDTSLVVAGGIGLPFFVGWTMKYPTSSEAADLLNFSLKIATVTWHESSSRAICHFWVVGFLSNPEFWGEDAPHLVAAVPQKMPTALLGLMRNFTWPNLGTWWEAFTRLGLERGSCILRWDPFPSRKWTMYEYMKSIWRYHTSLAQLVQWLFFLRRLRHESNPRPKGPGPDLSRRIKPGWSPHVHQVLYMISS